MQKTIGFVLLILIMISSAVAGAEDFDFDLLFQDNLIAEFDWESPPKKPEEALLVSDGLELGGRYNFSVNASRLRFEGGEPEDNFRTSLGSQIFLDARPEPNFRVFGKIGLDLNVSKSEPDQENPWKFRFLEFFSDFNYKNKVFFRAGKQNAKWGVGYFFSPADLISVGRIDPFNPEADREGPVALKIHYPWRSNNYYTYLLLDGVKEPQQIAVAPKLEYVLGKSELGLGGFYQKDKAPRLMLTVSSALGDSALFAEAVLSKGSDKLFLDHGQLVKKDDYFFQATVGTNFNWRDEEDLFNFTGAVQYYYNGEGTSFGNTVFKPEDKHNLAVALSWNKILTSKFSVSAFWLTNLSDHSGLISTTLALPSVSSFSPSVGLSFNYGDLGSEFGLLGQTATVFAAVTLGSGTF